ncbi:MAG: M28 family metallopeptidase [Rhodothermales bacterium]|nr:M28 family metallopeptidase [Rhodothermales bacterium]
MRLLSTLLLALSLGFSTHADDPILGFKPENVAGQRALETEFDSHMDAANLDTWMKTLTSRPHHVGSPGSKANAEFVAAKFREWGFDTEIEVFHVLFPTPKERRVELILNGKTAYRAKLDEPAVAGDASSAIRKDVLPPYNAYSADGDVTAELVYVNYGTQEDYEDLKEMGIDVAGKIVIARYGRSWRGIKPKLAADHGAIGCIIYSDPREDGFYQGDVYPEGAFRPALGVQRGSVADMPLFPGDPLTPGVGAKEDTERLSREEAPTLMKIPVLPISYEDAQPLLEALSGTVAPDHWRGALPFTYHIGPGPATVHLKLAFNWDIVPAYNVIARLPGSVYPDEWVIRGNHRDAWVFGAGDPVSGTVAMMEEARAIGELVKTGWGPKRTIVYASWDAEEPGLLGSTEWVEYHAGDLRQKAVAYINSDSNGRGFLGVGGSHTLEKFINEVGREVTDPQTGVSVDARLRAHMRANGDDEGARRADLPISPLGSGSDYTPFLQHLGIASLNIGYGGEGGGGSYHSTYDSYEHYIRFGDPKLAYGIALAQTAGRAALRLANADALPFAFGNFVDHVKRYAGEVQELTDDLRAETNRINQRVEDGVYALSADPTKHSVPPVVREPVPHLNFAPLMNAVGELERQAAAFDRMLQASVTTDALSADELAALNRLMIGSERAMTVDEGLPRRSWFRHHIYAPGFFTGYGVKTLPGVREAIEERQWDEATAQIERLAGVLSGVAALLKDGR